MRLPISTEGFKGYFWDKTNSSPEYISAPSQNCMVMESGKVTSRLGYLNEFSIGVDGSPARTFYHETYDIAFFSLGTKLFYRNFNDNQLYDTGVALTAGTVTRFDEFLGDVYLSNTTDGLRRIVVMRLNDAAANAGDATVTVDVDGAARLSVFSITAGDLRINGVNEAFNAVDVATGNITLTGTLSQSYANNTVAIVVSDISGGSGVEEASKILFWKSSLHLMGFPSATNADQPNNTVMRGQFVIGETGSSGIEKIIDFTFGTAGSTKILIGSGGKVTNILGVKDFIYFFTERKVFATFSGSINATTPSASSPGGALGLTLPDEKDELHGCFNEDTATVMGNNAITYITNDKRVMVIPIDTDSGAPISHPEEEFDVAIRGHLKNMDKDQTGAITYHYRGGRQTIYQIKIAGQWNWFIWDHNIPNQIGPIKGAWQAPQQIAPVSGFFERNGVLYGTDASDDTVYSFFTSFNDDQSPIYAIVATGDFNVGKAMIQDAQLQGEVNQPSQINIKCYVTNETLQKRSGSAKVILGSDYSYSVDNSVGAVPVGDGGVDAETTQIATWTKEFAVYPSEANRVQLIAENFQDGGYFSINSFALLGKQFPGTFSPSK